MDHEQARELEGQLDAAAGQARELFERQPTERLVRRGGEGAWSAVDNLTHLSLTSEAYLPPLREAVAELKARRAAATRPARRDLWGWLLCWSLEPPPRFRAKTTPAFEPESGSDPAAALARFLEGQQAVVEQVRAAAGLDTGAAKLTSVFNERIRYSVYSALCILAAHQRRHLWQASEAVRAGAKGVSR